MIFLVSFHRSLSSALAQWLHRAGLNMGHLLLPPHASNPEGHYEDAALVDLHDRLLRLNGTDWRFHEEAAFEPAVRLDLLERYVRRRSATTPGPWGAKDPRLCLFAPAWQQVLGERGRYLVLLRHWSGSLQSLLRRHGEGVAMGAGERDVHVGFWRNSELAARMWLAYQRSVLQLLEKRRGQCLVVTQQALLSGLPIIEEINARFGLELNGAVPAPLRTSLIHDTIEESVREGLSAGLVEDMERLWQRLLSLADHRAEQETPRWVPDREDDPETAAALLNAAEQERPDISDQPAPAEEDVLLTALRALVEDPRRSLVDSEWEERLTREARFDAEAWELLARALLERGKALEAERCLVNVLLAGKVAPYLFLLLGKCREAELDDEGAEHFYRRAIAGNDANPAFHAHLARLLLALGRQEEAEEHLRKALERNPGKAPLLCALANALDQRGRTEEAVALLQQQAERPAMVARQLATLQMKRDPENALRLQAQLVKPEAASGALRASVVHALASVEDASARRDLARRVANCWHRLGLRPR